jgi:hypothetical protein
VCETCQHWRPPGQRTGWRNAIEIVTPDDRHDTEATNAADVLYGECAAIDLQREWPNDKPLPLATTCDASEYEATLYTRAEFGCVMHVPTLKAVMRDVLNHAATTAPDQTGGAR